MANDAARSGKSLDEVRAGLMATNPTGRVGNADEFGRACAFLCSAQAGFMTGQNLQLDGGSYEGIV